MMLLICLSLVVCALLWAIPRPADVQLSRRLDGEGSSELEEIRPRSIRRRQRALVAVCLLAVLGAGIALDGVRGVVLSATASLVLLTVARLMLSQRQRRAQVATQVAVSRACSALASQLRIGQVPTEALSSVVVDHPVLSEANRAVALGGDPARVWRSQAKREPGCTGLGELARAWQVSIRTGAPMSSTLEQVAVGLSADRHLDALVASELAAPRATSKVMAALPVCGIAMGYLLGGDPIGWLVSSPPGWGCLFVGALLGCTGVVWIEGLARQAGS